MVLALIAFTLQSVSPVLAYEAQPDLLAQASTPVPVASNCAVPNRGIVIAYLLGPKRRTAATPADDVEMWEASKIIARFGASLVATFDLTVDAAGKPRKVVLISPPAYPGMAGDITSIYMASTYKPALHNCVPVTATIRTAVPVSRPEPSTTSVIVPVYPTGWSDQNTTACKVPTITRARFRPGFVPPTAYTAMLPAFPDSMKSIAVTAKYQTSVRVHVNGGGAATSAAVVDSSAQPAFDDAVVSAARRATYPLAVSNCKPLPTDYVWHTTFARTPLLFRLAQTARTPVR